MGYLTNSGIVFQNNDTDNFVAFTSTTGTDPIGGLYHKHPSTGRSAYRLGNDGSGYLGLIGDTTNTPYGGIQMAIYIFITT